MKSGKKAIAYAFLLPFVICIGICIAGGVYPFGSFNGFDVGFPHFIGSSMRMAHIASEMSAFFTNCTLCHGNTSSTYTSLEHRPAT